MTTMDETDPLTRLGEIEVVLVAKDVDRYPALVIRCKEDQSSLYRLEFFIAWSESNPLAGFSEERLYRLGLGGLETKLRHRIDDEPIESLSWTMSTRGTASFLPQHRITTMISDLYNAQEFVVEAKLQGSGDIVAIFEPTGLYWTVKPVLAACGQEIN